MSAESNAVGRARHHYECIAQAIQYLHQHHTRQPDLTELAQFLGFSPTHLQKLFVQWAGISPKRFLQVLTVQHARQLLAQQHDTLNVTYELGLSSTSRLHDLLISCEALTPAEMRAQGRGMSIEYGYGITPFGVALLAWTSRGICYLAFSLEPGANSDPALIELQQFLPQADLHINAAQAKALTATIFGQDNPLQSTTPVRLHLLLQGTNFQVKVWEALIRLRAQPVVSYQQLAAMIGQPTATRAVASAVARNNISWIIPCHRVIRQQGAFGEYRWGAPRKSAMLAWEIIKASKLTERGFC